MLKLTTMSKIEDIVYEAIDLNLRDELFKKVSELESKSNRFIEKSDLYEKALNKLKKKYLTS
jgi:hypothetical protein